MTMEDNGANLEPHTIRLQSVLYSDSRTRRTVLSDPEAWASEFVSYSEVSEFQ